MLVERLEEMVEDFNVSTLPQKIWYFNYGKEYWQNLQDLPNDAELPFPERRKYVLLLWQDVDPKFNEFGVVESNTITGEMLLVVRSNISDADYNFKYQTHIKNLHAESSNMIENFTICDEWLIKRWKQIEVENAFDTNLDGLKIQFTLEIQ